MSKKMLPIYLLNVLEKYSDAFHKLSQKKLIELIEKDYGVTFERKAIARMINELIELDYDIIYDEGYYLFERYFDRSQIQFLVDSVLSAQTLTKGQANDLLNKITKGESDYFKRSFHKIHNVNQMPYGNNEELFCNIEIISEAIENNKQLSFDYMGYGLDKKLYKRKEEKYIINPFELMISNGRYYLVANYDKYDDLSHYRIDKIKNIRILDSIAKSYKSIKNVDSEFVFPKHKMEHIYMFSGKSKVFVLRFENHIIDQIIDWVGEDCQVEIIDDKYSKLIVRVNETAMKYWLRQYSDFVEVMNEN